MVEGSTSKEVCLLVCWGIFILATVLQLYPSNPRIYHSYLDVIIVGDWLQMGLYWAITAFEP